MVKKVYIIENLDCANCAAKIEAKFNAHPLVKEAIITFSTKQLRLTAEDPDALLPELTEIARTVEHGAAIYPRDAARPSHRDHPLHNHDHECGCGHDHHGHDHECGCGHGLPSESNHLRVLIFPAESTISILEFGVPFNPGFFVVVV